MSAPARSRHAARPASADWCFLPLPGGITDIASDLFYSGLGDDAREVLRTLLAREREVITREGRWFLARIMPYRTLENVSKTLEAQLRKTQAGLHNQISVQALRLEQRGPLEKDGEIIPGSEETNAASP